MTSSISAAKQPKPSAKPSTAAKPTLATAAKPMTKPALVVFGTDSLGKPHASWFPAEEQEAGVKAAGVMGFSTLATATDEQVELARKLPRGRIFDGGRAFVPFVKHALHEKLTKLAADRTKTDQPDAHDQNPADKDTAEQTVSPPAQDPPAAEAPSPSDAPPAATGAPPAPAAAASAPTGAAPAASPPQIGSSPHRRPKHWDEITVGDLVLAYDAETEGWFDAIVLGIDGELLRLRWKDYPLERLAPLRRDHLALLPPTA